MWYSVVKSWSNQRRGEESLRLIIPARRVQVPRFIPTNIYIYHIYPSAPRPNIIRAYTPIRRVYNDNIILYSNNRRVIMCSDNLWSRIYRIQMTRTMVRRDSCVIAGFDDGSLIRSGGHVFAAASHVTWCVPAAVYKYVSVCTYIYSPKYISHMYVCVYTFDELLSLSPIWFCFSCSHTAPAATAAAVCWVYYYYSMLFFFPSSSNFAPWFLGVLLLWISADRERVMDSLPLPASLTVRLRINGYQKQNASFFFHSFGFFHFQCRFDFHRPAV